VHSLYRLLKCTIGGLHCHVITTEYRTRVHCIHMLHIGPCNLFGSIWSMFSYNTNSSMVIKLVVKLKKDWTRFIQTNSQPFVPADWKQKPQTMSYSHALSTKEKAPGQQKVPWETNWRCSSSPWRDYKYNKSTSNAGEEEEFKRTSLYAAKDNNQQLDWPILLRGFYSKL